MGGTFAGGPGFPVGGGRVPRLRGHAQLASRFTQQRNLPQDRRTAVLFGEVSLPGSDLQYYKISYEHRRYWELTNDFVISVNGEIAYGDAMGGTSILPLWENFYGGGPGSIRGFAARSGVRVIRGVSPSAAMRCMREVSNCCFPTFHEEQ